MGVLLFILYGVQIIDFLEVPEKEESKSSVRTTIVFNTFVFCQLFNEINCRKLNNGKQNLPFEYDHLLFTL
jgi:magnesium-transporting ATPase (P-type)